jgi:hypothetical protein
MQSVIRLMPFVPHAGFDVSLGLLGHDSLITRSRNTLLAQFIAAPAVTHIRFVDADISFIPDQVQRLLNFGEDVVAGMYPLKVINWNRPALERPRSGETVQTAPLLYAGKLCEGAPLRWRDGFATGLYAGAGFMLISRAAVTRMIAAYPETRYAAIQTHPLPKVPSPPIRAVRLRDRA